MEVFPPSPDGILKALEVLQTGGVVVHATETCYGLACDLSNIEAVKHLFAVKHRPETQPVSALFADIDQAKAYVEWNDDADRLASEYLPGPLTIILRIRPDAVKTLYPVAYGAKTIGVRISSHPLAQELVQRFGSPISTTSANVHGMENPYSPEDIDKQYSVFQAGPDLLLDSGVLPQRKASKIIDLASSSGDILRQ